MAGDGGHCWGRLGLLSLCVCVYCCCVCVCKGEREGKVTRGGHFKQATTTMALASAAVLNDCHVLVVSPSPPLLLLLYVVLAQLVVVVTGLLLPPLFVCGYKHIWH